MVRANEFPLEPAWRLVLKDLGVRPLDVLRRARLPECLLSRVDARVSTEDYFRFWKALEDEVDDPLFPLRLAEHITAEAFMPPLFAALCSPNLICATQRLAKYKRLIAPMALICDLKHHALTITFEWLDTTVNPPPSLVATELAFIVRLARMATREPIRPLKAVCPDPPKPASAYKEWFGVAVQQAKKHALTFSRVDAERPFLTVNDAMWNAFEPQLRRRLAELDDAATAAERVRVALLKSLPSGQASMELVAGQLAMSKRTLQRRLNGEGTSFQQLLNETREELARHYLSTTTLSCAEISFLLGYEDPNSFFRAFNDWTGDTPERLRQAQMH